MDPADVGRPMCDRPTHEDTAMDGPTPVGTIDPRYSMPGATPNSWTDVQARLDRAFELHGHRGRTCVAVSCSVF